MLNATTDAEHARYQDPLGATQRALVEPGTNYFVGRVNRELRRGQTQIGGIITTTNRGLPSDTAADALLRDSAYSGGLDFVHEWANRGWNLSGFLVGSRVAGSPTAILATQRSSTRYYQRPDAGHVSIDPTATSMSGVAGSVQMRKSAGLHWTSDSWIQFVSPGYEINDIGFLQRSDRRAFGNGITYNQRTPGKFWRDWRSTNYVNYAQNFDGDTIDHFYWTRLAMTHLSYWQVDGSVWYEPERPDDRFTRGGPLANRPAVARYIGIVRSDVRKPITGSLEYNLVTDRAGSRNRYWDLSMSVRTSPRWNLAIGPRFQHVFADAQYVTTVADATMAETYGARYIFSRLDQTEVSLVTRLNYTFTPDLSFELYAQPLVSNGDYGTPREFQRPREYDFKTYGEDIGTISQADNGYVIDPDGEGPAAVVHRDRPQLHDTVAPRQCRAALGVPSGQHALRGLAAGSPQRRAHDRLRGPAGVRARCSMATAGRTTCSRSSSATGSIRNRFQGSRVPGSGFENLEPGTLEPWNPGTLEPI